MQEDFLHYVWQHKKFDLESLKTTDNQFIVIKSVGYPNENSGPDFFNAQININNQLWAGNVEIHIKSSDWYLHNHETDRAYDNVILHVVWEHNTEIFRVDNSVIPTLELKSIINPVVLKNYERLRIIQNQWIPCEKDFNLIKGFHMNNWLERLYLERLEQKFTPIFRLLKNTHYDWEAVMFWQLARAFGLKINSDAFWNMAKSFPYSVFRKIQHSLLDLEALLFGQSGLLIEDETSGYFVDLKNNYLFLKNKYNLQQSPVTIQFFRLRPANFPTIRLAQLAQLYHQKKTIFNTLMQLTNYTDLHSFFNTGTSSFWDTHYTFGKSSKKRPKRVSKSFIDLLIINAVIPMKFAYNKAHGLSQDKLLTVLRSMPSEKNSTIKKFQSLNPISKSAFESQALLQLKANYCDQMRCMHCAVGSELLNRNL